MSFRYDGHLCIHELLHRINDGKSYDETENTVSFLRKNLELLNEAESLLQDVDLENHNTVDVYVSFLNIHEVPGHIKHLIEEYPNLKYIRFCYTDVEYLKPEYATQNIIDNFLNFLKDKHQSYPNYIFITDPVLRELKKTETMSDQDFLKIIIKLGNLYWTQSWFQGVDFDVSEDEYPIIEEQLGDIFCSFYFKALQEYKPEILTWDIYKEILRSNIKPEML